MASRDFMTVQEAMDSGLIPESYHKLFSKYVTCSDMYCGAPLEINQTRTVMKCSNPNCPRILASRVLKIYNHFGLVNFGSKNMYNWVISYSIHNAAEALLNAPPVIQPDIVSWMMGYHTAGEILELLALPGIGTKASNLLSGVNDFKHFEDIVEAYGLTILMMECGVNNFKVSTWHKMRDLMFLEKNPATWEMIAGAIRSKYPTVYFPFDSLENFELNIRYKGITMFFTRQIGGSGKEALNCGEVVFEYWDEIKAIFAMTHCLPATIETRKIIITGDIINVTKPDGTMFERLEFIDYVNKIALPLGIRYQNSTAFTSSEFIIADAPSNTRKYQRGLAAGNLISSSDFINLIKERVREHEQQQQ